MRRYTKLISCLLLSGLLSVSACKSPDNSDSISSDNSSTSEVVIPGQFVAKNGITEYSILVPDGYETDQYMLDAALDMQKFLGEATNATYNIVTDSQANQNGKYISLGKTALAETCQIQVDRSVLGKQGYIVDTVDDDIFIDSPTSTGVCFGVYGWLEQEFAFDYFAKDTYTINTVDEFPLKDYSTVDIPDIQYRIADWGIVRYDAETRRRMRYITDMEEIVGSVHNALHVIQKKEYNDPEKPETYHPNWFTLSGDNICYTARGDEAEYKALVSTLAEKVIEAFLEKPNVDMYFFTNADTIEGCKCEGCKEVQEKYSAFSAGNILFFKDVIPIIEERLIELNDPRADTFKLVMFAYNASLAPPVTVETLEDGTTKYVYDDIFEMKKHGGVYIAHIQGTFSLSLEDPRNKSLKEVMNKWAQITNILMWPYDTNFYNYLYCYDTVGALQDFYRLAKELNCEWIMHQGQSYQTSTTGWSHLKVYLESKLMWDVDKNVDELIERFFKAMYGSQSQQVLNVFRSYHIYTEYQVNNLYMGTGVFAHTVYERSLWTESILLQWINDLTSAEEELKKSGELQAYDNVRRELIQYLYIYVEVFDVVAQPSVIREYAYKCADLLTEFNVVYKAENSFASTVINEYRNK